MKHLKKVLALVLVGVMMMGMMSVTAFAAGTNRTISVAGLDTGDKVNFYKVLAWADDTDTATANHAVNGWYWVEPFKTAFASGEDMGEAKLRAAINDKNKLVMTDTLAGDIARALNGTTVKPVNDPNPVEESGGTATYTFENSEGTAADGLYVAIVTPKDQDTIYSPIFVHLDSSTNADSFTVEISKSSYENEGNNGAAKKSKVELNKSAKNANDYNGDDGDTAAPGDTLSFTVNTTIPGYGQTFKYPQFKITDTMNGLELKTDTIVVKVGGEEIDASNYDMDATVDGYSIDFEEGYLKGINVPTDVEITYDATVKAGENTNVIKEKNTVELEFSHDPTTESEQNKGGDKNYKKDVTNHYTFSIDANNLVGPGGDRIGESGSEIIKIGVDADGNPINSEIKTYSNVTETAYQASPLKDAKFKLYKAKKDTTDPTKWVIDETQEVGEATSDAAGRINFTGLDAGVYFLKETEAPAGYVKNSDPVQITIDATLEEKTVTEYYDQEGNWYETAGDGDDRTAYTYKTEELVSYTVTYGTQASTYTFDHVYESDGAVDKWNIQTSNEAPQSIKNMKGVELPSTGGIGTTLFYLVGAILVLGSGVVLVTRRRMSVN